MSDGNAPCSRLWPPRIQRILSFLLFLDTFDRGEDDPRVVRDMESVWKQEKRQNPLNRNRKKEKISIMRKVSRNRNPTSPIWQKDKPFPSHCKLQNIRIQIKSPVDSSFSHKFCANFANTVGPVQTFLEHWIKQQFSQIWPKTLQEA